MQLAIGIAAALIGGGMPTANADESERAQRIVSLDYCADQFVLKFVPPENIVAVSPDADTDFSYMREATKGIRQVRPLAENVLALQPDVVVRSYGGGPFAAAFFERAGIRVLQVPFATDFEGIKESVQLMANGLGQPDAGQALVKEMDRRLDAIEKRKDKPRALYVTPSGYTTGRGTLVNELLVASGLDNFEQRSGWWPVPLERLAYESPDLIAAAFFDSDKRQAALWSAARHPLVREQMRKRPGVSLPGAWTSCSGWYLLDAVEALASGAQP